MLEICSISIYDINKNYDVVDLIPRDICISTRLTTFVIVSGMT